MCEARLREEALKPQKEKTVFKWGIPGTSTFPEADDDEADDDGNEYPDDDSGSEGNYDSDLDD